MVIWRIHPFRPARRAVADAYRSAARLVADLRSLVDSNADPAAWDAHARGHRRAVRDTIERARTAVQDTLRVRGQASARAFQGLIRIEAMDQIFGAPDRPVRPAGSDARPGRCAPPRPACCGCCARPCSCCRYAIRADDPGRGGAAALQRLSRLGPAMDAMAAAGHIPVLAGVTDAILERLRIAATLTAPANWQPGALPEAAAGCRGGSACMTPLRANLNWQSAAFRHALRTAVVAGPALAVTLSLTGTYQHWLTITLILTMQPFYALTWQRALERDRRHRAGRPGRRRAGPGVHHAPGHRRRAVPAGGAAFTARAVNFGVFIALLTPMVVLLTEFSRPGTSEFVIAGLRAAYTVAGGLAGGVRLHRAVAQLGAGPPGARAGRRHHGPRRLRRSRAGPAARHRVRARRWTARGGRRAWRATTWKPRSPARWPSRAGPRRAELQAAMVTDAALRRMAGRLSALQLDPHHADGLDAGRHCAAGAPGSAGRCARSLPGRPSPRPARTAARPEALLRIARQIELLDGIQQH